MTGIKNHKGRYMISDLCGNKESAIMGNATWAQTNNKF